MQDRNSESFGLESKIGALKEEFRVKRSIDVAGSALGFTLTGIIIINRAYLLARGLHLSGTGEVIEDGILAITTLAGLGGLSLTRIDDGALDSLEAVSPSEEAEE
ncbi:MAG TPA: hypothetical protein VIJ68_01195 [Candidatus Saccharimonadales bacterium]